MKAVVQRVKEAWVEVEGDRVGSIGQGLLVLVGIGVSDTEGKCRILADKVLNLRIFDDQDGRMNRSALDIRGSLLLVSQFTLLGDCRKGRRPSYSEAAPPEIARRLYDGFVEECRRGGLPVATGVFQAHMQVGLVNDGPVTLLLEV
jgi:D-aminoacyl-tRNA deacylase